ncbi:GIY-YIG nuclease family protein [Halomonas sp. TBZ9]|uniref:GIY-YIG nuclease family protein n=1 Tax=Vreelandella azerica TaxID=2732867 RepID=A0A7Y3TW14_9GAMM|nr:GIY-YIG nuclease family protein [Halomonas azerica]NOG31286.1 GIY-YIG nuclease family protein [Halomonas azerica]
MASDTPQGESEKPPASTSDQWYLYLLECRRGTYIGITNNLAKRYQAHCEGKGARYTRANPPLALLGAQPFADRAAASRAEYQLKQKSPAQKRQWAAEWVHPKDTQATSV